ncbi:MAG: dUTP diphosphatase [Candidatus Magasanikbacteria bacterium]|nr:dUTP diphosphatase [Candidatus Magasanikbacteria bacterium]
MEVKIKRVDKSLPLPHYQTKGSVAFDIYTRKDISIEPKEIKMAPSNLIIETPQNFMLVIAARSSLQKRSLMLANNVGIVDQDYCGENDEISTALYNFGNETVEIKAGERIAQGIFVPIVKVNWQEVDKMSNNNRGGFGSTGI